MERAIRVFVGNQQPRISRSLSSGRPLRAGPVGFIRATALLRAIDIHEGDRIDEKALKALIRAAVALNTSK
jgi:hypothetical protein